MGRDVRDLCLIYTLATLTRWWFANSDFQKDIANRVEITTPINSIKRVVEGQYRLTIGLDPFSSDILHESPFLLHLYTFLLQNLRAYVPYLFMLVDLISAHALYIFAKRNMLHLYIKQEKQKHEYVDRVDNQLLTGKDLYVAPVYVTVAFLFNPYTIFNCVAMTTTTFTNLLLSLFLISFIYNLESLAIIMLSWATLQTFYPVILLSPLYINLYDTKKSHLKVFKVMLKYFVLLGYLLFASRRMYGSWDFLEHSIGFMLHLPDQQPNVGVFWYFFMEMFEHFRPLFLCAYQMNVTLLYLIPLSIKYYKDPPLLAATFITLMAIFKSYPCAGDFALTLALLPCWKHLYYCMQQIYISFVTIIVTTALAPILWDLWIYLGTANANFYFGATLAFVTAHIFVFTDISFAFTKREYLLNYGTCRMVNGKNAKLILE